jgi:hypothetical protein
MKKMLGLSFLLILIAFEASAAGVMPQYQANLPWDNLSKSVRDLAQLTVGLEIKIKGKADPIVCTGIILNEKLILTAAHCVFVLNGNGKQLVAESIDIILEDSVPRHVQVNALGTFKGLSVGTAVKLFYLTPKGNYSKSNLVAWQRNGADIAIIELQGLNNSFNDHQLEYKNWVVGGKSGTSMVQLYPKLTRMMYVPESYSFYGLGWGSKENFHYNVIKPKEENQQFNFGYPEIFAKDRSLDLEALDSINKVMSWGDKLIKPKTQEPYYSEESGVIISNTNVIKVSKMFSESGDSGGPLIACKQESCELVGVLMGRKGDDPSNSYYINTTSLYLSVVLNCALTNKYPCKY